MAWLHKFSNFQQRKFKKEADDRIRELEIMIRRIDIEIILARRREGRQEQVNRRRRGRRQIWTREWLSKRVMFGQCDTLLQ